MQSNSIKKSLVVAVIFLFISVAFAPSINFNVVKALSDDDFVEVTSQACGIKGFGDKTLKLTKQQYQNLEQYLVNFRERLNQTTTREEAIPIFKEAVKELNKYGLLPKGMSVEQAQKLVLGAYSNPKIVKIMDTLESKYSNNLDGNENHLCLIAGNFVNSVCLNFFQSAELNAANKLVILLLNLELWILEHPLIERLLFNRITSFIITIIGEIILNLIESHKIFFNAMGALIDTMAGLIWIFIFIRLIHANITPLPLMETIDLGFFVYSFYDIDYEPANGFLISFGWNGMKQWNGSFYGNLPIYHQIIILGAFPGIFGFTGISILNNKLLSRFVLGSALGVNISSQPPPIPL